MADRERELVQPGALLVGEAAQGGVGGPSDPGDRPELVATDRGDRPVPGQVEKVRLQRPVGLHLQHLGGPSVEADALGGGEAGLDRVADQGVHEALVAGQLPDLDHPRHPRFVQRLEGVARRHIKHGGQHAQRDVPADDRGRPEQPHAAGGQATESGGDGIPDVRGDRHDPAADPPCRQHPSHLGHEERIATGQRVHLAGLGAIDPLPGQRGELLADGSRRQPGELDLLGDRLAQQFREVRRVLGLGAACGHHQQDPAVRQRPGEVPDQQDRRPVRPVRVVEDDQQGPLAARVPQQPGERVELAEPRLPVPVGRGR